MNILLLLDTIIFLFEVAKTHENLKRNKSKGRSERTLQPFKH